MSRIEIPVCMMEFEKDGNTIWIHSPRGATVLRIKTMGKIVTRDCKNKEGAVSHSDIIVQEDIDICLGDDVTF